MLKLGSKECASDDKFSSTKLLMCFKLLIRFAAMLSISCICLCENSTAFSVSKRTDELVSSGYGDSVDLRTPFLVKEIEVLLLSFLSLVNIDRYCLFVVWGNAWLLTSQSSRLIFLSETVMVTWIIRNTIIINHSAKKIKTKDDDT